VFNIYLFPISTPKGAEVIKNLPVPRKPPTPEH
jgi:hypothetical protein